jgi:hypothetical protein
MQQEGLTIPEIYKQLEDMSHALVVRKYLDMGFPTPRVTCRPSYC